MRTVSSDTSAEDETPRFTHRGQEPCTESLCSAKQDTRGIPRKVFKELELYTV